MAADSKMTRQEFLTLCGRGGLLALLGGGAGALLLRAGRADAQGSLWQIDPEKCTQCGQCATHCVKDQSAVRCRHAFKMCGYCELCTGFFGGQPLQLNEGAENQICPAGAIRRSFIEDPYYQYEIDEDRCLGCARCAKDCKQFGNGSLYLQVRQDLCLHCNQCAIAAACPSEAFVRVGAGEPYRKRPGVEE